MKKFLPALLLVPGVLLAADKSPDMSFYEKAAHGGIAEVEMGQLAQEKARSSDVKAFGAMMVKDHSAANAKLKTLAMTKGIELPTKPSVAQMATKTKLQVLSGDAFDKSYVKSMVKDHEEDIAEFEKEARDGKDAEAKALAAATLPTLRQHLTHIREIAAKTGVEAN